jgi:hypothetical protein
MAVPRSSFPWGSGHYFSATRAPGYARKVTDLLPAASGGHVLAEELGAFHGAKVARAQAGLGLEITAAPSARLCDTQTPRATARSASGLGARSSFASAVRNSSSRGGVLLRPARRRQQRGELIVG